jgi:hypothetical protein
MARKVPNFSGFTLEDIAKANAGNNNAINSTAKNEDQFINQNGNSIAKFDTNDMEALNGNSNANNNIASKDVINSTAKNNTAKKKTSLPKSKRNSIAKLSTNESEALNRNSNADIDIASKDVINSITKNNTAKKKNSLPKSKESSITKLSTDEPGALNENSNANNDTAPRNVNQALFSRVKDYLYRLLGDNESVEVKLNEVIKNLNINPHSFYKYLQTLRKTDFTVVKLRYSTEIRRRVS